MTLLIALAVAAIVVWLLLYMFAQKPVTTVQQLIHQGKYAQAVDAAGDDWLHRAEALKLMGKFDEAIAAYRKSDDPAAREGIALSLAHLGRDLEEAQRLMEEQIALYPQIQEFQALGLAYVLLRRGKRDDALRIFRDNAELLETRFRDDYTDPDPLLAETLWMYAKLSEAAGDASRAVALRAKAAAWAPSSAMGTGAMGSGL
ncbi:MAG TPA: hypothetical protein VKH35_04685 [Thermoanaerobaculia bacterium]|nr:hypothetical protein [Thermoanaerobaculia bacterium]